MKRIYKKPETTVVAVAPVKLLNPSDSEVPYDPTKPTQEGLSRETVRHTTIPSDDLWEE